MPASPLKEGAKSSPSKKRGLKRRGNDSSSAPAGGGERLLKSGKKPNKYWCFFRKHMGILSVKTGIKTGNNYNIELFFFSFYSVSGLLYNMEVRNANIGKKICRMKGNEP
jgi:hypothetical protein